MTPAYAAMDIGFAALLATQGEAATYISAGGEPVAIQALFNEAQIVIDPQTQVSTTKPVARTWSNWVPKARNGDRLTVRGVEYYVITPQIDGYGSGTTTLILSRETQVPTAPSGLTAVLESNKPRLTWTRNATNNSAVEILSAISGDSNLAVIATLPAGVTTYLDVSAADGPYAYKVRNTNQAGPSAPSNLVNIDVP